MPYPEKKSAGKLEQARALIRGAVFEALHSADKSEVKPPLTDRLVFVYEKISSVFIVLLWP